MEMMEISTWIHFQLKRKKTAMMMTSICIHQPDPVCPAQEISLMKT